MKKNWKVRVCGFFGLVYLVSGLLWLPVILSGQGMSNPVIMGLMALITFIPSVIGIAFTYLVEKPAVRADFWRRFFHWPRVSHLTLFFAVLIFPVMNISAYLISAWLAGQAVQLTYASVLITNPLLLAQFLFVEITFGALSEELGWRGYILDVLQSRWSPLISSLVLGLLWGLWHTPAFLTPGLMQYELGGVASFSYIAFVLSAVSGSIWHTWVYNRSGRSTLLAGFLMHFLMNFSLSLISGTFDQYSMPDGFSAVLLGVNLMTAVLLVWFERKSLLKKPTSRSVELAANSL